VRRIEWMIFFVVWVFLSANPSQIGPRCNCMVQSILCLTITMVDHQEIYLDSQIDPYVPRLTPDEVLHLPYSDLRRHRLADLAYNAGHYYSGMPPGLSWAAIPIYLLVKNAETLVPRSGGGMGDLNPSERKRLVLSIAMVPLLVAPLTALAAVLMFRLLLRAGARPASALWGVGAFAWGSLIMLYGTFVSHNEMGAVLLFIAFYLLFSAWDDARKSSPPSHFRVFLSGFIAGYGAITAYPEALTALMLLIYGANRLGIRRMRAFVGGLILVAIAHACYSYRAFESPIETPYAHRFVFYEAPRGFYYILFPRAKALWELTFGPVRGFFTFMPWAIASIVGAATALRKGSALRPEAWLVVSVGVLMLLFNSSLDPGLAPYGMGPRFLLGAIPFLAFGLVLGRGFLDRTWVRGLIAAGVLLNATAMAAGTPMYTEAGCRSAHGCLLASIFTEGAQTYVMHAFAIRGMSFTRTQSTILFLLWEGGVAAICYAFVCVVNRRFRRNATPTELEMEHSMRG
jgi:hypothetical protein